MGIRIKWPVVIISLALVLVVVIIAVSGSNVGSKVENETGREKVSSEIYRINTTKKTGDELRAVWVPFMALDMSNSEDKSEDAFQKKFDKIVETSKKHGMNTLVVHVRSHGDAMYSSKYFPWSHLITGEQGQGPLFDPMEYMIEACHENGLKFHAWINPLRVQSNSTPSKLSAENNYNKWLNDDNDLNDNWIVDTGSGIYYNPAYPAVRELIINGIREISENYDVDGIHLDDYFYPEGVQDFDTKEYDEYCSKASDSAVPESIENWRKSNINLLVSGIYSAIKSIDKSIEFGISPQSNVENNHFIGADVYTWATKKGYVDYLCPQIYFSKDSTTQPFEEVAKKWDNMITSPTVSLYIGLGLYKASSDVDEGLWLNSDDDIASQIDYCRENIQTAGFMVYSYAYLEDEQSKKEVKNMDDKFME